MQTESGLAARRGAMDKMSFMRLWDVYHGLLTPTQQEITDLYFNLDLTLSEIAEQKNVSRQSVSDCMNKCKKQLEEYEEKLHFAKIVQEESLAASFRMTEVGVWAEQFLQLHPEYAQDIANLCAIMNRDYAQEAQQALKKNNKV